MGKRIRNNRRRNSPLALILAGAGLILIAVAIFIFVPKEKEIPSNTTDRGLTPANVNYPAPELSLVDVSGENVSLLDYRGQVVLVNNWATWCPPCKAEMPDLEAFYTAHKNDGFTLIGISAGDTKKQVQDFIKEYELTFPMWLDPDETALAAFRTMNLPSSFVIDATGTVRLTWSGAISFEELERFVTPMFRD